MSGQKQENCPRCGAEVLIAPSYGGRGTGMLTAYSARCNCGLLEDHFGGNDGSLRSAIVQWNKWAKAQPRTETPDMPTPSTPQTDEDQKTARALAALDAMATTWAATFDIRKAVEAMASLPDGTDRLIAFVKQAYCEGLYAGRT